jgi:hypothetical protein
MVLFSTYEIPEPAKEPRGAMRPDAPVQPTFMFFTNAS